jgi:hypothetical protein
MRLPPGARQDRTASAPQLWGRPRANLLMVGVVMVPRDLLARVPLSLKSALTCGKFRWN